MRRAVPLLLDGLTRLEYRGYDSAGLAIHQGDTFSLQRRVGQVENLTAAVDGALPGTCGIAHTRWATHGGVSEENAHPHLDTHGSVAVVHNGIIENMGPLKSRLERLGVVFRSQTDSEILSHLIGRLYAGDEGEETRADPVAAVRAALALVRGTWGIAVMFHDRPGVIVAARNGSPMVLGIGDGENFLASDPHALVTHTRQVVFLQDGELAILDASGVQTFRAGALTSPAVHILEEEWGGSELEGFPHYMLKEIHDQPEALRQCLSGRVLAQDGTAKLGGLDLTPRELVGIRQVGLIGCGTAYYACQVGALAIEQLARIPATAEIASEYRYQNPCVAPDSLYFAVSQSGETADTIGAIKEIQLKGGTVMGVINVVGSTLARACGRGAYIHSGPEMAVASTKAFSNMVAALSLFALQIGRTRALSVHRGRQIAESLQRVPELVEKYLADPGPIDEAVALVSHAKLALFLGRGVSSAVAAEGALKLMEVAYVPSIAYPAGEMKHGPIALLEEGSPVIVIAPGDVHRDKTMSNLHECRARGARIVLIHTEGDDIAEQADVAIAVPKTLDLVSPLVTVLPLQLLAYKAGLVLDRNIDRPRNLAKSVTVE